MMERLLAKQRDAETLTRARKMLCDEGGREWFCVYHPWQWALALQNENYEIEGVKVWAWRRSHRLECFRLRVRSERPECGASTRSKDFSSRTTCASVTFSVLCGEG